MKALPPSRAEAPLVASAAVVLVTSYTLPLTTAASFTARALVPESMFCSARICRILCNCGSAKSCVPSCSPLSLQMYTNSGPVTVSSSYVGVVGGRATPNAWHSVLRLYFQFSSPVDPSSLRT